MSTDPRSFGHIYLRGTTYWVRYRVAGEEYRESTESPSVDAAEKLLARREAELGVPGAFVAPATKRTTFAALMQLVRDDYELRGLRSLDRVEDSIRRLALAFAGARALTITADRVSRYAADRLGQGAARQTIKNELGVLHRGFVLAKRAKLVVGVPEFPDVGKGPTRTGFFEPAALKTLLGELPEPLRAVITFAWLTGWRIPSEVLPLQWAQVDFRAGVVRLEPGTTKNGEARTFPFAALPPLERLLKRQRAVTTSAERAHRALVPWVFHREGRGPIGDFHKAWRAACTRAAHAGAGPLRQLVHPMLLTAIPHDLRRSAVRNLVRAGVPEVIAMKLTGHLTRSVFDRYNIVSERDLAEGVAKLAVLHRAGGGTTGAQSGGSARAAAR